MYCYVLPMGGSTILIWYEMSSRDTRAGNHKTMMFRIIDVDRLRIIEDIPAVCDRLRSHDEHVSLESGDRACQAISTSLTDGQHRISFPSPFQQLNELLVLAHSTAPPPAERHLLMHLRIWAIQPAAGTIEVIPQDWYNDSDIDFGYQWVTRLARDPHSRRIIGEGFRIDPFELDDSGRKYARRLT